MLNIISQLSDGFFSIYFEIASYICIMYNAVITISRRFVLLAIPKALAIICAVINHICCVCLNFLLIHTRNNSTKATRDNSRQDMSEVAPFRFARDRIEQKFRVNPRKNRSIISLRNKLSSLNLLGSFSDFNYFEYLKFIANTQIHDHDKVRLKMLSSSNYRSLTDTDVPLVEILNDNKVCKI